MLSPTCGPFVLVLRLATLYCLGPTLVLSGQAVTRRDSSGVAIVDVRLPPRPALLVVDPKPIALLGGTRDELAEEIRSMDGLIHVVRDSRSFIVSDQERIVKLDAQGKVLQTLAHKGDGPGEFRSLSAMCLIRGDTLVALDRRHQRASLFDPAGKYVRAVRLPGYARGQVCVADGRLISEAGVPQGMAEMGRVAPYVLVDLRSGGSTPIGRLPVSWVGLYLRAVSIAAVGQELYVGEGSRMGFAVYDARGQLIRSVRTDRVGAPVPAGETERRLKDALPAGQSAEINGRIRAFMLREPPPKRYDPMRGMLVAPDRTVWTQETDSSGEGSTWLVFQSDGTLLGRVAVPRPPGSRYQQLVAVDVNEIVVRYLDENDSHTIAVYRVRMPPTKR